MNMSLLDWSITVALVIFMTYAVFKTKKYTRSVADFLAANRCAGKYLLGVSEGAAGIAAISIIAISEAYYHAGFSIAWWAMLPYTVAIVAALTGWVVYRYRQTRALTLAQLLEMRYSKNFRIFAGMVMFVCGIINFAIFPGVGAKFFMYYCGLPSFEINSSLLI